MRDGAIDAADIRRELCLDEADFNQLVAGTRVMSVQRQLLFASLLIERAPRLVRQAKLLRQQALAAIDFARGVTVAHTSQPLKWSGLKAQRA
jgi:hypothetical protein